VFVIDDLASFANDLPSKGRSSKREFVTSVTAFMLRKRLEDGRVLLLAFLDALLDGVRYPEQDVLYGALHDLYQLVLAQASSSARMAHSKIKVGENTSDNALFSQLREDWREAPDVSSFYGRIDELSRLEQWIIDRRCRLVAILGMGGVGKTTLPIMLKQEGIGLADDSLTLVQRIRSHFDFIIWQDLRNAPTIKDLLAGLIKFLSCQQEVELPNEISSQITRLLCYLRQHRCLLILDNFETIMQGGESTGRYCPGYEPYGDLLRRVGDVAHQSCLLLTSREKPQEIALREGKEELVYSLHLYGLNALEGRKILERKGSFSGSDDEWEELIKFYNGNPLALKLVADHIIEVYSGSIPTFLKEGKLIFHYIQDLLYQHWQRMTTLEREAVYWLAINRTPMSPIELTEDVLSIESKREIGSTLQSLQRRLDLERSRGKFTLHPLLIEYFTEAFIEHIYSEIEESKSELLHSHALMKASTDEHIRESQVRLTMEPLRRKLIELSGNEKNLEILLKKLLEELRNRNLCRTGYTAGNLLNMLCQLGDLNDIDFSNMCIKQAYIKDTKLLNVDFSSSDFSRCVFSEKFVFVNSVAYSNDDRFFATGHNDGEIRLWRRDGSTQLLSFKEHTAWVQSMSFSPDGNLLASGSGDSTVKIWDTSTGECLRTLKEHQDYVASVRFSPNGELLVSSGHDTTLRIWKTSTGKCLHILRGHKQEVMSVRFSPDGNFVVSGSKDTKVKIWDVHTGKCLKTLPGHTKLIMSVAWSPAEPLVASASEDRTVRIWRVNEAQCQSILRGHTHWVWAVAFSPDGQRVASASHDKTLKIWDVKTKQCLQTLSGHQSKIWSITFNPQGTMVASASDDVTVRFWDIEAGTCVKILRGYTNPISAICFRSDSRTLVSSNGDLTLKIWDVETGHPIKTLAGSTHGGGSVAFSPKRGILVSCDGELVRLWDVNIGKCFKELKGHTNTTEAVVFSPNEQLIASSSRDHTIRLWDVDTHRCRHTLEGHTNWVWSVAFSPDGQTLASGSDDLKIKLWNVETGECKETLSEHTSRVRSVAFRPGDGQILASGSDDGKIKLWDVRTGKCLQSLEKHNGSIESVAFSPDGQFLASGGSDSVIHIWNAYTWEYQRSLEGHEGIIKSIVFSPDNQLLASCTKSKDQTIKIWDVKTSKHLKTLRNPRPYEGTNITGVTGLTEPQEETLKRLGAIEDVCS
jgi:WD40 repeat protein